jgi:antitoxin MazE
MKSRIQHVQGDLTLVIPPAIASSAKVVEGTEVDLTVENGRIVVSAAGAPKYVLQDLLAQVTEENLHAETDWGPSVGNEAW